ncbi:hypothetical protein BGLT_04343 [Caballeronia glathei]|uniref:eCIS core domain-containing protein n=1 Tax=Caballeronia glathei TaxID=60547 RepID=A0A069Q1P3_9BURK|nr:MULTISPECIES: DUF4157 domain-containing protein [Burkholderiaceae]KDR43636.1 hypothetical protein BG61_32590 [Caballeronia glathei]TCK43713.1 uncharacterized protein DUF4157 [Paraburkholderia sp. BL8N3]CDY75445.1 hypothetical protein BGLT_04343 [Caballeronia glathei]
MDDRESWVRVRAGQPSMARSATQAKRAGEGDSIAQHAPAPARAGDARQRSLLTLQMQYGNQYVARMLSRSASEGSMDDVERSIDSARGGGQALDHSVRSRMEPAFGADFSGVRVHTDARADELNQTLSARAFATGQDIFFRQGQYDPGSSNGRELLAHELTHVVQQNGPGVQRKMTVSEPDDPHEAEADAMARAVMRDEHEPGVNREMALDRQPEAPAGDEDKKEETL